MRVLLRMGANYLYIPPYSGLSVYQKCQMKGNRALSHLLKEWGADYGLTPFHAAAAGIIFNK